MAEKKLDLDTSFLQEGREVISIPAGGVPVIDFSRFSEEGSVAAAANFLRSGCEAVQIIWKDTATVNKWRFEELKRWFNIVSVPLEVFKLSFDRSGDFGCGDCVVVKVIRTIA